MGDTARDDRSPAERVNDVEGALQALTLAVREALTRHKRAGNSVAVWRDGAVYLMPPEEIPDYGLPFPLAPKSWSQ